MNVIMQFFLEMVLIKVYSYYINMLYSCYQYSNYEMTSLGFDTLSTRTHGSASFQCFTGASNRHTRDEIGFSCLDADYAMIINEFET